jgi:hypothetical protein
MMVCSLIDFDYALHMFIFLLNNVIFSGPRQTLAYNYLLY